MPREKRTTLRERLSEKEEWSPGEGGSPQPEIGLDEEGREEPVVTLALGERTKDVPCPECGKTVSQKSMRRHVREQHSPRTYACRFCLFTSKRQEAVEKHERGQHAAKVADPSVPGDVVYEVVSRAEFQEPEVRDAADVDAAAADVDAAAADVNAAADCIVTAVMTPPRKVVKWADSEEPAEDPRPPVVAAAHVTVSGHPDVSGLRNFAPPEGYEWLFGVPGAMDTDTALSEYVEAHQREVVRFGHLARQFAEIHRRAQACQTRAQFKLVDRTVDGTREDRA